MSTLESFNTKVFFAINYMDSSKYYDKIYIYEQLQLQVDILYTILILLFIQLFQVTCDRELLLTIIEVTVLNTNIFPTVIWFHIFLSESGHFPLDLFD